MPINMYRCWFHKFLQAHNIYEVEEQKFIDIKIVQIFFFFFEIKRIEGKLVLINYDTVYTVKLDKNDFDSQFIELAWESLCNKKIFPIIFTT